MVFTEYYGGRPHGNRSNLPFDFIEFAEKFVLKNVDLPIKFVRKNVSLLLKFIQKNVTMLS